MKAFKIQKSTEKILVFIKKFSIFFKRVKCVFNNGKKLRVIYVKA